MEQLSERNLEKLIDLVLELWSECDFNEEFLSNQACVNSENDV